MRPYHSLRNADRTEGVSKASGMPQGVNSRVEEPKHPKGYQALQRRVQALERELLRARSDLERAQNALQAICYLVCHNLRAPLRCIHGFSTLLDSSGGRLDTTGKSYTQRIRGAVERLEEMLQGLLGFGRLGVGHYPITRVDPGPLLHLAVDRVRGDSKGGNAAHISIQEPMPRVWANPGLLGLVFVNLLSNACKFTSPGIVPRVLVCYERRPGSFIRFNIHDRGIGLAPELKQHFFGPVHALFACSDAGAGLGLLQAQAAAERMHARLGVDSVPAQGSCFWIELPEKEPPSR